jgi:hypothetical protein
VTRIQPVVAAVSGLTRFGTGAPAAGTGNAGDYYIDERTGNLYGPKTGAAPTVRASASAASTSVTIPASTQAGDIIIAQTRSVPTGFTSLGTAGYNAISFKVAVAGDAGASISGGAYGPAGVIVLAGASSDVASYGFASSSSTGTQTDVAETPALSGFPTYLHFFNIGGSGSSGPSPTVTNATELYSVYLGGTSNISDAAASASQFASVVWSVAGNLGSVGVPAASAWPLLRTVGRPSWTAAKTAACTAVAGDAVACNTTGGTFAVTMPASPAADASVWVKWVAGTTAPTIAANTRQTLDPTWSAFSAVGGIARFTFNASTSVWELV